SPVMTAEERESRLTAYALNDPSLSPLWRAEIEKLVASDASARQAVEETGRLGQVLTQALAAEAAAAKKGSVVPIPAARAKSPRYWARYAVAAAAVLIAIGGTYVGITQLKGGSNADRSVAFAPVSATTSGPYGDVEGLKRQSEATQSGGERWKEGDATGAKYEADMRAPAERSQPKPDGDGTTHFPVPRTEAAPAPVTPAALTPPPPPGPGGPAGVVDAPPRGPGTPGFPGAAGGPPTSSKGGSVGSAKMKGPAGRGPGGAPTAQSGDRRKTASTAAE